MRATHLGMCFGVRDAIHLAMTEARRQPLTILGELVHNEAVLSDYARVASPSKNNPKPSKRRRS